MGAPIARHLQEAGHRVRAWNRTADKAKPLAGQGVRIAQDPAEAVDGAEAVVTMLADADGTLAVMGDAARCLRDGTLWWQAGTLGIEGTEQAAAFAAEHGLELIDGPVLGTRQPAEDGALTILASGAGDVLDRAQEILGAPAAKVLRCGPAGAGTRLKLVVNHWIMALMGSIAETVAFARGLGVDAESFLENIAGGAVDAGYADVKGKAMCAGEYPPSFALSRAAKDAGLIADAAERHDVGLTLVPAVLERFRAAEGAGLGDQDMAALVEAVPVGATRGACAPRA
jgi:3-hydroxyisobutyrate dehydrogenase